MNFNVNPHRAVSFKESTIRKVLESSGSLTAEVKYDGVRGNIVIKPVPTTDSIALSSASVFTRSNKTLASLAQFDLNLRHRWAEFQRDFMFPNGLILDGELMVKGMTFQKSAGRLRKKEPIDLNQLIVYIYDVLPIEVGYNEDEFATMHCVRSTWTDQAVDRLQEHFPEITWIRAESYEVFDMEGLIELYNDVRAKGHEGLILKDPMCGYKRGKKTGMWKMKPEDVADGKVVGINWGTEGLENEGLIIGFEVLSEDGHIVNANGITKAQMTEFTLLHTKGETFTDWQVQFKFMERTDDGGFRHPSFDCWRGQESDPTVKI